jgi:hydroxyacylglutathione hydrolase
VFQQAEVTTAPIGKQAMPLELITIPCLQDNYAYLIGNSGTGECALIDVPEPGPINAAVAASGWSLTTVILTHHHWDHIDGLDGLDNRADLKIIGAKADAHRLPPLDLAVSEGESVTICGESAKVLDVSGHTVGHIALHFADSKLVFTADSLMAMGCGRLFEGTPAQMYASMEKLAALPDDTLVCSGHEYTTSNANFAVTVDPNNADLKARVAEIERLRGMGKATVPSLLSLEKATNPFLRASDAGVQAAVDLQGADPVEVFTEVRARKDRF